MKSDSKIALLKQKLSPEHVSVLNDLLSERDAEWQIKLRQIPLLVPLLAAFGLVSTFYGFEKILNQTFFIHHPWILLSFGVFILLITGAFYRKL